VGNIDLKMISTTENSNKFPKKQGLGRQNQLRMWKHFDDAYHSIQA
jgi:hypothetical protein